jgi:outer membrane protein assembly factor BamB
MRGRKCVAAAIVALTVAPTAAAQQAPTDYTQWRGQGRDGSASSFTTPKTWPEQLTRRWKVEIGEGYATPILVGPRVYMLARREGNEVMMALDAETGKSIWETRYPAPHKIAGGAQGHGQGPKSTPLFHDGKLYTLGITGIVSCFNAADGRLLWQKPAPSVETLYNNSSMSPIADGGTVIFHVGGHNEGALTAFDAANGNIRWAWRGDGPAYASPMIATLGGVRQVVAITQKSVVGVSAASGDLLWQRPFVTQFSNNAITPVVFDDLVIVSGFEKGVTAFRPTLRDGKWDTETRWENNDVSMFMSNPVLVGDTLYGLSQRASGQLFALNARTGKVLWLGPPREATNSAVVKAGEVLFFLNDDGELIVARSNPEKLDVIRRYTVADSATWAQPTISGRRLFVKDLTALALWTVD